MKKLILTLIFCLLVSTCFASLASTTVWEVRTTGASDNGGGFDSALGGTDYSQSDTPILAQADLSCLGGTTQVTSALATFTSVMVGNIMYISDTGALGNFVVGYYEIMTYIDANNVTLDRDPTNGTADTLASFKVGGAVDHPQRIENSIFDGNIIWIKKGTYTDIGSLGYIIAGYFTPSYYRGYNITRGDNPTGTDRPTLDGESTTDYGFVADGDGVFAENFIAINSNVYGFIVSRDSVFRNCKASGNNVGFTNVLGEIIECESTGNTVCGFYTETDGSVFIDCYAHNEVDGFSASSVRGTFINCISVSNSDHGFGDPSLYGGTFINCIAYNNLGVGFETNRGTFINCIALDNDYGFSAPSQNAVSFDYNCYYNNTTADLSGITAGSHDVNADPLFTDPTGTPPDFTLQSSSPCIGVGNPGMMPGVVQTSYKYNIGVDQSDHSTGGTTTDIFGGIF